MMNQSKLMICLLVALAGLFQQTSADCLAAVSDKLELVEIPQFATDVEAALRRLNPALADLPLLGFLKSKQLMEQGLDSFFSESEQDVGGLECANFIVKVDTLLKEAGCQYGALDLEDLLEENRVSNSDRPKVSELVAYMDACVKI